MMDDRFDRDDYDALMAEGDAIWRAEYPEEAVKYDRQIQDARQAYQVLVAENRSHTVGQLIKALEGYDPDMPLDFSAGMVCGYKLIDARTEDHPSYGGQFLRINLT